MRILNEQMHRESSPIQDGFKLVALLRQYHQQSKVTDKISNASHTGWV